MRVTDIDMKQIKLVYILVAMLLAVCSVITAYLDMRYVALAFIVAASLVILLGAFLVTYLYRKEIEEKAKEL